MDNFPFAVEHTLRSEGRFTIDTGGRTMYGITEAVWLDYGDGITDITRITQQQAMEVYRSQYWNPLRLDRIEDKFIAAEIFDTAVNCGLTKAALFAQMAHNFICNDWPALKEDGVFGSISIAAINRAIESGRKIPLLLSMNGEQYIHYRTLVRGGTKYDAYARGWMKRIILLEE